MPLCEQSGWQGNDEECAHLMLPRVRDKKARLSSLSVTPLLVLCQLCAPLARSLGMTLDLWRTTTAKELGFW